MKSVPATPYCGRRARLRASVRGEGVEGWGGLWMRMDDARGQSLVIDNMQDRPLRGTFEWTPIEVVLDVSADARVIAHGMLMAGRGEIAMGDVNLETVDDSVPTTGPRLAPGWLLSGSAPTAYEIELAHDGKAATLRSVSHPGEDGYGTLTRQVPADAPGRRVRFRASLRAEGAGAQVTLCMRADDEQEQLVIVNQPDPPLKGPFDWREEAAELTIPETATVLSFGVVLAGQGSVDMKDAELELAD